jgi:hypothetical protein
MALTIITCREPYIGNGVTTAFATEFFFLSNSVVSVIVTDLSGNNTTLNQGTDYTVAGAGNPTGGTVTCAVAPTSGYGVTILRTTPNIQTTTFEPNDSLPASSLENGLDIVTMQLQELSSPGGSVDRSIKYGPTEPAGYNSILPPPAARAGKQFGFDNNGLFYLYLDIGQWRGNWVTGTAYSYRDLFQDSSTSNIYVVAGAYTSGASVAADVAAGDAILVLNVASVTTSAASAATSATAAAGSATSAASSASSASSSATSATGSASSASTSATTATTQAGNASTSATASATSATAAAASATAAAASATAAAASVGSVQPFDTNQYAIGSGTNTYTATLSPAPTSYTTGMEVSILLANANSGAATLNLNSLGAKALQKNGAAFVGGEIAAGMTAEFRYDGTNFQLLNPSSTAVSGFSNIAVLTSGTSWTVPTGITRAKVTVIGGGASGGVSNTNSGYAGGGGGSGGYSQKIVTGLTPGNTVTYAVGAGGASVTGSAVGLAGAASSFAAPGGTLTANGGAAGAGIGNAINGSAGGTASGGTINMTGQAGSGTGPSGFFSGVGGSNPLGLGGGSVSGTSAAGNAGTGYGGGGSGGIGGAASGAGAPGAIILEY